MWQWSGWPTGFDYHPSQGSCARWVIHFSISIKIKLELQWCRLTSELLALVVMSLCDLVIWRKKTASLLHPPPEEAFGYWIKSHATMNSQFGAALALLNHQQQEGERFFLSKQFMKGDQINSNWICFFLFRPQRRLLLRQEEEMTSPQCVTHVWGQDYQICLTTTVLKLSWGMHMLRSFSSLFVQQKHCESCMFSNSRGFRCPSENLSTLEITAIVSERRNSSAGDVSYYSISFYLNNVLSFVCFSSSWNKKKIEIKRY